MSEFNSLKRASLDEAVDARRNQRHFNFVEPSVVGDRLTPQSYRPEITAALMELKQSWKCVPFSAICTGRIRQGITPDYGENGLPCIKIKHVHPVLVDSRIDTFTTENFSKSNHDSAIGPNTILINRSGATSIGRTAVYLSPSPAFVSDDVFACPVGENYDASFLACYLSSWWGKRTIEAGINGSTGQLKLPQEHLSKIMIPVVPDPIQHAIGCKIRKADHLGRLADVTTRNFLKWLSSATSLERLEPHRRVFLDHIPSASCPDSCWITAFDPADRVDPWVHHIALRTIQSHLLASNKALKLTDVFDAVTERRGRLKPTHGSDEYYLSVLDVDSEGRIQWQNALRSRYDSPGTQVVPGDILYSTLNPQETRVALIPDIARNIVCSPEFSILRAKQPFAAFPHLLCAILRTRWIRVQSAFLTRSSSLSRRRLAESDLCKILIPWVDDGNLELDSELRVTANAQEEIKELVNEAIHNVTSYFSNDLDEARLMHRAAEVRKWIAANPIPQHM